jgi:hypothetical protein
LLGGHGRDLEAHVAEQGDHQQRAHAVVAEQPARGQAGQRHPGRRVAEPGDGQDQQHRDLGAQEHAQHAAVEVDAEHAQGRDQRPGPERPHPPVEVQADLVGQVAGQGGPEHAVEADLEQVVGEGGDQGGADAGGAATVPGRRRRRGPRRW